MYVVFKVHTTDLYQKIVYIKAIKQKRTELTFFPFWYDFFVVVVCF